MTSSGKVTLVIRLDPFSIGQLASYSSFDIIHFEGTLDIMVHDDFLHESGSKSRRFSQNDQGLLEIVSSAYWELHLKQIDNNSSQIGQSINIFIKCSENAVYRLQVYVNTGNYE